jgi:hypothetical protein
MDRGEKHVKHSITILAITLLATTIFTGSVFAGTQFINQVGGANLSIGNNNELFIDNTNDRVGVGTMNPLVSFQVGSGNTANTLSLLSVNYDSSRSPRGGIAWHDTSSTTGRIHTEYDGTQVSMVFGSLYNSGYNSNNLLIIRGNGTVGIGNTAPNVTLEVSGTGRFLNTLTASNGFTLTAGSLSLPANSVSSAMINDLDASKLTGTVASARVSGSYTGVTGVGTISAGVWQGTAITDSYISSATTWNNKGGTGNCATGQVVMNVTTGGVQCVSVSGGVTGSGSANRVALWSSGSTLTDSNIVQNNSRVGINTTAPNSTLHVVGDANVTGVVYASNISSNSPLNIMTAGTTRLFINDTTGYIGVGTMTPQAQLHINGSFWSGGGNLTTITFNTSVNWTGLANSSSTITGIPGQSNLLIVNNSWLVIYGYVQPTSEIIPYVEVRNYTTGVQLWNGTYDDQRGGVPSYYLGAFSVNGLLYLSVRDGFHNPDENFTIQVRNLTSGVINATYSYNVTSNNDIPADLFVKDDVLWVAVTSGTYGDLYASRINSTNGSLLSNELIGSDYSPEYNSFYFIDDVLYTARYGGSILRRFNMTSRSAMTQLTLLSPQFATNQDYDSLSPTITFPKEMITYGTKIIYAQGFCTSSCGTFYDAVTIYDVATGEQCVYGISTGSSSSYIRTFISNGFPTVKRGTTLEKFNWNCIHIATSSVPTDALDVDGWPTDSSFVYAYANNSRITTQKTQPALGTTTYTQGLYVSSSGMVGINTQVPSFSLDIVGSLRTTGSKSGFLSDVATSAEDGLERGDVVSMTFEQSVRDLPGGNIPIFTIRKSRNVFDLDVIGVVFEKLSSDLDGYQGSSGNAILAGDRVQIATHNAVSFLKASAENGPIIPGDYLMPARTAGYAMKADEQAGIIIGRSLDVLANGSGRIRAFISIAPTVGVSNLNAERLESAPSIPQNIQALGISKPVESERAKREAIAEGTLEERTNVENRVGDDVIIRLGEESRDVVVTIG